MKSGFQLISAGAGSGKTYTLTQKLKTLLSSESINPAGVIATTFTVRAAAELQERVRQKLISTGQAQKANEMGQALIGTVNGVCGELLKRFAFEAGLSPQQKVVDEEEGARLFAQVLESSLEDDLELIKKMNAVSARLGIVDKKGVLLWRQEIKNLVSSARSNNMSPETFPEFAAQSSASLLAYFPKVVTRDLTDELQKAIKSALDGFDPEADKTKGSADYFKGLKNSLYAIKYQRISWPEWIKLSKKSPTKKSKPLAEPIQMIAGDYARHSQLHEDIRFFIEQVFDIAGKSLNSYQAVKTKQGLVDFVDQEQLLLNLLDNETVKACLKSELQLLMVDEFQDTSPIQLAVFVKLSKLADKVIWVGDIKQSIYGFRGSDPDLMLAVTRHIESEGVTPEILGESWRSRPPLVQYINNLFTPAFSNSLSEAQVKLDPARPDTLGTVVECWSLQGSNKSKRAGAQATEIKKLVESQQRTVVDKQTKQERLLEYGDIAILCRTNRNLIEIAEGLSNSNIPVDYKRPGLMGTPEAALALACLRRVADQQDTLASAEIRALTLCEYPETWLADRLQYLQTDKDKNRWGEEDFAPLQALAKERSRLPYLTPREVMEQAILVGEVRKTVVRWSKSEFEATQRLRNLDAFLGFADQYIEHCHAQSSAATVPGLILWLMALAESEQDWYARASGNAVSLVTHHGAKGLEWPVVIAMDLESKLKPRIWGLSVLATEAEFKWDAPLEGRKLKYWPSFFGGQSKDAAVKETVENGDSGIAAQTKVIEETKRLLYVSLTRPRDLLILPFPEKTMTGEWMQTLGAGWMLPEDEELELPDKTIIPTAFKNLPEVEEEGSQESHSLYWPKQPEPLKGEKHPSKIAPSSAMPLPDATIGQIEEIAERINLSGNPDVTDLGLALHAIIATEIINRDGSLERAAVILAEYELTKAITAQAALDCATNFIEQAQNRFNPNKWHVEQPINLTNKEGQQSKGWIDLLLETDEGWVIIDHKSSPQSRAEWKGNALKYSGQLDLYAQALQKAGKTVTGCWVHFAVTGGLLSLQF